MNLYITSELPFSHNQGVKTQTITQHPINFYKKVTNLFNIVKTKHGKPYMKV